ncbi:MSCRAMM family protein [Lacticaseibacillus suihuaensis]
MQQQLAQLRRLGRLLGAALSLMGVFWVAYFVLVNAFANTNAETTSDVEPRVTQDPRMTVDSGIGSDDARLPISQIQTYANEFPATQNDYLGSAQHFTIFANTVTLASNVHGNVAAGTISSGGNGIASPTELKSELVTGPGANDTDGRDVFYYQNFADGTNTLPDITDDPSLNPKLVLGSGISGLQVTTRPDQIYAINGHDFNHLKAGQVALADSVAPYINISAVLDSLDLKSDELSNDDKQEKLTDLDTADPNLTIYDLNNTGTADAYGDTYENAYALKLTKKDAETGALLAGARFTVQYPVYPATYTGSGSPDPVKWADMAPGTELPVTDDDGNPTYDENHKLITKPASLYDAQHQIIPEDTAYNDLYKVADGKQYGLTAGIYILNTNGKGEINVAVNVSGNYRFREVAAPEGYAMPTTIDTDVTTFRTSTTPMAREFNIPYDQIFAVGSNVTSGGKVYFLNMDLSKNAAPVEINIDFTGAPDNLDVGAPNVVFVSAANSPKDALDAASATPMPLEDDADRAQYSNKILWNYKNAEGKTISVSSDTFYGTILAPGANLINKQGHIFGSMIANSVNVAGGEVSRWDLQYNPWTSTTDEKSNNRIVTNEPSKLPDTTSVTVTKKWSGLTSSNPASDSVTMELYQRVTDPDGTTHDTKVDHDPLVLSKDNNWSITVSNLPTRTDGYELVYYVKETDPPAGYTPVYEAKNIDGKRELTVTNAEFGFDITKLTKDEDEPLAGASYTLTDLSNPGTAPKTITTTEADLHPTTKLRPGTYLLQETKAPTGLQLSSKIYALRLSTTGNPVTGTTYDWQETVLTATTIPEAEAQLTDDSIWTDLPAQTDNGFSADNTQSGPIHLVHFTQEDALQPLTITKVNPQGDPLGGAVFFWQRGDDNPGVLITDIDGHLTNFSASPVTYTHSMQAGVRYKLWEISAPVGYTVDKTPIYIQNGQLVDDKGSPLSDDEIKKLPVTLELTDGGYAMTFTDQPEAKPWTLKVVKVDQDTGQSIDGAAFPLTGADDKVVTTLKPTAKAGATIENLDMGATYTLKEGTAPDGYVPLNGAITIKTASDDSPPTLTWQGTTVTAADAKDAASHQVVAAVDEDAHVVTLTVKDPKKGILPKTGGAGPLVPLILATMTFAAAAGLFWLAHVQRKAGERG